MAENKAIGQRVAEAAATKLYNKYGDKIPLTLNPEEVADLAYEAIEKRQEQNHKSHKVRHVLFGLCKIVLGAAAGICVLGTLAALVGTDLKKLCHHHAK